jgi:hypothetical protein
MPDEKPDLLKGMLDLLVLQILSSRSTLICSPSRTGGAA